MRIGSFRLSRSRVLVGLVVLSGLVFIARLFYLQVVQYNYYSSEALKEHTAKFIIPASRGEIYAQNGNSGGVVPLVLNQPAYTVFADPRYVQNSGKTADTIRRIAGGNVVGNLERSLGNKELEYVVVARQITDTQQKLLKQAKLPGIGFQQQEQRVYPEGNLAAQVLGYVDSDSKGQYGIEQYANNELAGKPGMLKAITDVNGIPLSVDQNNVQTLPQNGKNVVLTLDRNIQTYAEQALAKGLSKVDGKHGSIMVMDPRTGAVLAMANIPTYDPSKYYDTTDYSVFANAVVDDPYEAGSVVKSLTMAAGLNEGVVKPSTTYDNTGSVTVDGVTIHNAVSALGTRTMTDVFKYSLNTGAVYVLEQLGGGSMSKQTRDKLFTYFSGHFMFGKPTGIEQTPEAPGVIIGPEDVQGNNIRYANMSFGQGLDTTMIQVASAFSSVVNGGTYYQPHLIDGILGANNTITNQTKPTIVESSVIKASASSDLRTMLHDARTESFPGIDKPGYFVGGKTGTSQTIDPKSGQYSDTNAIGTYLGFGGNSQDNPQYVIMVRIMDAKVTGYAGSVAVEPVFADVSNWLLDYLKIQPSGGN